MRAMHKKAALHLGKVKVTEKVTNAKSFTSVGSSQAQTESAMLQEAKNSMTADIQAKFPEKGGGFVCRWLRKLLHMADAEIQSLQARRAVAESRAAQLQQNLTGLSP